MLRKLFVSASVLVFCTAAVKQPPQKYTAVVRKVIDGDTVAVYREPLASYQKVRLVCIDAPEKAQKPYGLQSKDWLSRQVLGKTIEIEEYGTDQYQRVLGKISVENRSINLASVQEGQSVVYRQYMKPCESEKDFYLKSEEDAKRSKLGLWNQTTVVMPWDYRKNK
jgi:micrococcal nuclease